MKMNMPPAGLGSEFEIKHRGTFAAIFAEAEDMAAELYLVSCEIGPGVDSQKLTEVRMALRQYRNLLLTLVGSSPL